MVEESEGPCEVVYGVARPFEAVLLRTAAHTLRRTLKLLESRDLALEYRVKS